MALKVHDPTGFIYRTGTNDANAYKQVQAEYAALEIPAGSFVLDIGAHIGFFTKKALDAGAAAVVAIEPESNCFNLLQQNVGGISNVQLIHGAVTDEPGPVIIYEKSNTTCHTIIPGRKTSRSSANLSEVSVAAYSLSGLLAYYKPQVVKADVEAAELFWNWNCLNPELKHLAVELTLRKRAWLPLAQTVCQVIQEQGFTMVEAPDFESVTWWDYSRRAIFRRE